MARQTLNTTICRFQDKWGCPKREMLLAPILAFLFIGCVAPGRLADLGDCGTFGVGTGYGLDATVQLGAAVEGSLGVCHEIKYCGWNGSDMTCKWSERQLSWPLVFPSAAFDCAWHNAPLCAGTFDTFRRDRSINRLNEYKSSSLQRDANNSEVRLLHGSGNFYGKLFPFLSTDGESRTFNFHNCTKIEGDVSLGVVGVKIGVNPLEILDFLLGFVGLDIARDDPPLPRPPESGKMGSGHDWCKLPEE